MNQKYSDLLALDLAFYEIHNHRYNPIDSITDFWAKYDINKIRSIIEVSLKRSNEDAYKEILPEICQKQVFAVDLLRLLIAYFQIHTQERELRYIDISIFDTTKVSLQELEVTKRIHSVFTQISQTPNQ